MLELWLPGSKVLPLASPFRRSTQCGTLNPPSVFPSTSPNELRVTLYDPLRGVPVVELEVIKEGKLRHG